MSSVTWLGHASFRVDSPGGKRIYVDPFLGTRSARSREQSRSAFDVIAITHGHGDHVGETVELRSSSSRKRRRACRAQGAGSRSRARRWRTCPARTRAGRSRSTGVKFTLANAFHSSGRRRRLPRRGRRDRARARERDEALLRRRHVRLRRHAADRAHLLAGRGGPADRRPLHDGPARGRGRARAARRDALHPLPLRNVPAARGTPDELRSKRRSVEIIELQPGETTTV